MEAVLKMLVMTLTLLGCTQTNSNIGNSVEPKHFGDSTNVIHDDSVKIIVLLQDVYKWHESNKSKFHDFDFVLTKDTITGLNIESYREILKEIQKTDFFSREFISNYEEIGNSLDSLLKRADPKYISDGPNFAFEEADVWNGFQDDGGSYWDEFNIADFKSSVGKSSLTWWLQGEGQPRSDKYLVEFIRENGKWKISYMSGFDKKYYK